MLYFVSHLKMMMKPCVNFMLLLCENGFWEVGDKWWVPRALPCRWIKFPHTWFYESLPWFHQAYNVAVTSGVQLNLIRTLVIRVVAMWSPYDHRILPSTESIYWSMELSVCCIFCDRWWVSSISRILFYLCGLQLVNFSIQNKCFAIELQLHSHIILYIGAKKKAYFALYLSFIYV